MDEQRSISSRPDQAEPGPSAGLRPWPSEGDWTAEDDAISDAVFEALRPVWEAEDRLARVLRTALELVMRRAAARGNNVRAEEAARWRRRLAGAPDAEDGAEPPILSFARVARVREFLGAEPSPQLHATILTAMSQLADARAALRRRDQANARARRRRAARERAHQPQPQPQRLPRRPKTLPGA